MPVNRPQILRLALPLAGLGLVVGVWAWQKHAGQRAAKLMQLEEIIDPLPHRPVCDFWQPWRALVAPSDTATYLQRIRRRLEDQSQRGEEYRAAMRAATHVLEGDNEQVCILGRVTSGDAFSLDIATLNDCQQAPVAFFDSNLALSAEKLTDGGFVNAIEFRLGLQDIDPRRLRTFLAEQVALLGSGYQGWSEAFPHYFALNHRGLALTAALKDPDGGTRVTYTWLNQAMLTAFNQWSRYLLGLGDMITIESSFDDGTATGTTPPYLRSELDTGLSAVALFIGPRTREYLAQPAVIPLTVAHNIIVRFAGLHIKLIGMKFSGLLVVGDEEVSYSGAFSGVDDVEIAGSYRGLGTQGLGGMITDIVRDAVRAEVERLQHGNHGRGWPFKIALKADAAGGTHLLYATSFQSPVNFINVLKAEKTQANGFVLPSDEAISSLNLWARQSFDALIKDQARSSCR